MKSVFASVKSLIESSAQKRGRIAIVCILSLISVYVSRKKNRDDKCLPSISNKATRKKANGIGVNADFILQIRKLLPICVPGKSN